MLLRFQPTRGLCLQGSWPCGSRRLIRARAAATITATSKGACSGGLGWAGLAAPPGWPHFFPGMFSQLLCPQAPFEDGGGGEGYHGICQSKEHNTKEKSHIYCNDHWGPAL